MDQLRLDANAAFFSTPALLIVLAYVGYVVWNYRDRRATGTNRRDDLYAPKDRTFFLGDLLAMIKNRDRALDSMFGTFRTVRGDAGLSTCVVDRNARGSPGARPLRGSCSEKSALVLAARSSHCRRLCSARESERLVAAHGLARSNSKLSADARVHSASERPKLRQRPDSVCCMRRHQSRRS